MRYAYPVKATLINIPDQDQDCHSERSEESGCAAREILRCAQNDSPDGEC